MALRIAGWLSLLMATALVIGPAAARDRTAENILVGRWYGEQYWDKTWRAQWIIDRRADKTFSMELRFYGDVYGDRCWMRRLYKMSGTWSSDGKIYSNRVLISSFRETNFLETYKVTRLAERSVSYWDRKDRVEYTDTRVDSYFTFPSCGPPVYVDPGL